MLENGEKSSILRGLGWMLASRERRLWWIDQWRSGAPSIHEALSPGVEEGVCEDLLRRLTELGVTFIPFLDERYPAQLRETSAPPLGLFSKGRVPEVWPPIVAVVGTRRASIEATSLAERLSRGLAKRGVMVASGLALGIDGAAHRGALSAGRSGSTVSVLGCSPDIVYPPSHRGLAKRIIEEGGVILSEYPSPMGPMPWQFLERNRIIAGLAVATVVVQAPRKSGALTTAYDAVASGRDVYAVPWSLSEKRGEGCNRLLSEGAIPLTDVEGFLSQFGSASGEALTVAHSRSDVHADAPHGQILALLRTHGALHPDQLRAILGVPIDCEIMELELAGSIRRSITGCLELT